MNRNKLKFLFVNCKVGMNPNLSDHRPLVLSLNTKEYSDKQKEPYLYFGGGLTEYIPVENLEKYEKIFTTLFMENLG